MSAAEELSIRDYPPPARAESPIQLIQGWYYVVIGLWVAIGIAYLQSPTQPTLNLTHLWIVRGIGALVAVVGIGLIRASRQKESISLATGGAIALAVVLGLIEVVAMANGLLPATFMLDTGMEFGFLIWWMVALYYGESLIRRPHPPVDGMGSGRSER
jgi:hypothetical protein